MIISASRRTDIPAFYSDWFLNRIKEGFVDVRNPMNYHQVSRISLSPDVIDCIVFWSKNPKPMLDRLDELKDYKYYFQFTITPYDTTIEKAVPGMNSMVDTFKALADKVGSNRVVWRYDPILLTDKIDVQYHLSNFYEIAKSLEGYTKRCVISFIDLYKKTRQNIAGTSIREPNESEMREMASVMCSLALSYGIKVESCAEAIDLSKDGVEHGHCIDKDLIEDIVGYKLSIGKDKNQRKECGCVGSIDIGQYNTCLHDCVYCYANYNKSVVELQRSRHYKDSTMLVGSLTKDDVVKERKMSLLKDYLLW